MKQKFTITIADIEMNILSEGTSEEVELTVNKVDRRIREICLRSPRISKNEAALLAALEFCSERDMAQRELDKHGDSSETLKEENSRLTDALDKLQGKVEALRDKYESAAAAQKEKYESAAATQKEKYEGRIAIMKEKYESRINSLRMKLDESKKPDGSTTQQMTMELSEETANSAAIPETSADKPATPPVNEAVEAGTARPEAVAMDCEAAKEEAEKLAEPISASDESKKDPRIKGKNKVGAMFDLLTFNNV
jgi:cell division protein ZapA (FtsZ GTPase activity inhibitor)